MATLTATCIPSAVQRCSNGQELASKAFFACEPRLVSFRSHGCTRVGPLKVTAEYSPPLIANTPFSKNDGSSNNNNDKKDNSALKTELLSIIAGLDRGLLATANDETAADMAARKLEAAGEDVELPRDLELLQGRWRLVFTSGFFTGSLGGERPGPQLGRLVPLTLGQVYQRIDVASRELDNIVDLRIGTPWPLPPIEVEATLAHSFEVTSTNGIRIIFQKTTVKPAGGLPSFDTPPLPEFLRQQSSNNRGAGSFDTTYLDEDFRISRGDRGELRIFVRA